MSRNYNVNYHIQRFISSPKCQMTKFKYNIIIRTKLVSLTCREIIGIFAIFWVGPWYGSKFTLNHANVRYIWPLVWPQYAPPETRPRLHNTLGLSQGLESSTAGPQIGVKTAAIAMQLQGKLFKVYNIENGMFSTHKICQILPALWSMLKIHEHAQLQYHTVRYGYTIFLTW
jgi:hypothetical protein